MFEFWIMFILFEIIPRGLPNFNANRKGKHHCLHTGWEQLWTRHWPDLGISSGHSRENTENINRKKKRFIMSGETSLSGVCQIHHEQVGTCEMVAKTMNVRLFCNQSQRHIQHARHQFLYILSFYTEVYFFLWTQKPRTVNFGLDWNEPTEGKWQT